MRKRYSVIRKELEAIRLAIITYKIDVGDINVYPTLDRNEYIRQLIKEDSK